MANDVSLSTHELAAEAQNHLFARLDVVVVRGSSAEEAGLPGEEIHDLALVQEGDKMKKALEGALLQVRIAARAVNAVARDLVLLLDVIVVEEARRHELADGSEGPGRLPVLAAFLLLEWGGCSDELRPAVTPIRTTPTSALSLRNPPHSATFTLEYCAYLWASAI